MVINRDGARTRHYAMLRQLNGEVLAWGPTLLQLESTGVYHTEPLPQRTAHFEDATLVESIAGGMALVGEFEDGGGQRWLMVVNRDYNHAVSLRLKLRQAAAGILELSRATGKPVAPADYAPDTRFLSRISEDCSPGRRSF